VMPMQIVTVIVKLMPIVFLRNAMPRWRISVRPDVVVAGMKLTVNAAINVEHSKPSIAPKDKDVF